MKKTDEKALVKQSDNIFSEFISWIKRFIFGKNKNYKFVEETANDEELILKDIQILEKIMKKEICIEELSNEQKIRLIQLCEKRSQILVERIEIEKSKIAKLKDLKN